MLSRNILKRGVVKHDFLESESPNVSFYFLAITDHSLCNFF